MLYTVSEDQSATILSMRKIRKHCIKGMNDNFLRVCYFFSCHLQMGLTVYLNTCLLIALVFGFYLIQREWPIMRSDFVSKVITFSFD